MNQNTQEKGNSQLDILDRKIMYELDLDARASASEISKKIRRSKETVNFRINRLIGQGFIKEFYAVINTSAIGWYYYKIYLKFRNITPENEETLFAYIQKQSHIAWLGSVEGYYDCIFLVMVKKPQDLSNFFNPFMAKYGEFIQEKDIHLILTVHRLNQKFLYNGGKYEDWHYSEEIGNYVLDETDSKIIGIISKEARLPTVEIAKITGIELGTVNYRLKKLEKDRIILAYVTAPNFDYLRTQFVQINISLKKPDARQRIINYFDSTGKCLFAVELVGKYDLTIELHVQSNEELKDIIGGFRQKFVEEYNDYDVSTINREYVIVWTPFA